MLDTRYTYIGIQTVFSWMSFIHWSVLRSSVDRPIAPPGLLYALLHECMFSMYASNSRCISRCTH